jgi:hypothetical protein
VDEVITLCNRNQVRYLVIGGQAMRLKGLPRFTMDWDLYIPPRDAINTALINRVLGDILDIPVVVLGKDGANVVQTYQTPHGVLQFHLGGPGLPPFDDAVKRAVTHRTEANVDVKCICGTDLLASKRACNRPQDQQDIRFLEKKQELGSLV